MNWKKIGRISVFLFFLSSLYLLFTKIAYADYAPDTVRVGYYSFSNFNAIDSNGHYSGYGYEYLQEIAQYTNWEYEYIPASWEDCLTMLEHGEIDILGSVSFTPDRSELYDFATLESGIGYTILCVSSDNTSMAYEDFAAFNGMKVGILQGSIQTDKLTEYCKEHNFEVTSVLYKEERNLAEALNTGEVDAILTSNLRKAENERTIAKFSPIPFYFATTKGNSKLLEELNYAQTQIKLNDPYFDSQLYEKYYSSSTAEMLVFTKEEQAYLNDIGTIKAAYNKNWAPIEYQEEETGEFSGITADLFQLITQNTDIEFEFIPSDDITTSVRLLKEGAVNIICGFEKDYDWMDRFSLKLTTPYFCSYNMLITNPADSGKNTVVALPKDFLPQLQYSLRLTSDKNTAVFYPTTEDCLRAVANGEASATYANVYVANRLLKKREYSSLYSTVSSDIINTICIAVNRTSDPLLLSILNKAIQHLTNEDLDKLILSNSLDKIDFELSDYISENPEEAIVITSFFFVIIIIILFFSLHQRSANNKKIYKLLYIDSLTGIWNYNKFRLEAEHILSAEQSHCYALVYTDIDKFKYLNDSLGYVEGDNILCNFAHQLQAFAETGEIYARIANDNFIALLKFTDNESFTLRLKNFEQKFNMIPKNEKEIYRVSLTSGIYVIQNGSAETLPFIIDCANSARKLVKGTHNSTLAFYNDQLRETMLAEQEIEAIMDTALEQGQFVSFLQPQFYLNSGKLFGMEALVRWFHPQKGMISPGSFIPLFEKNGFIVEIDFNTFEQVCKLQQHWLSEGKECVPISSNFSRLHVKRNDFIERLCTIADKYQVPRHLLELEITESAAEEDQERFISLLQRIKELGFTIAMDDFGSGYSSLNILKSLPVDVLKLDKEFLEKSFIGQKDRIIIEGVVSIAEKLNLTVICEGVETEEQAQFLRDIKCMVAQGFLYARPMPVSSAEQLLPDPNSAHSR